jgi:hypothetical protein
MTALAAAAALSNPELTQDLISRISGRSDRRASLSVVGDEQREV